MLTGTFYVERVAEESICRNSLDYRFTELGDYRIHSTALMPNIPFEPAEQQRYEIDESIFINDEETKLRLEEYIYGQNYLTTKYVGRAPLEYYVLDPWDRYNNRHTNYALRRSRWPQYPQVLTQRLNELNDFTRFGREFLLICRNGDPSYPYRAFGTENAIRGYNRDANEAVYLPMGRYDDEILERNPLNYRQPLPLDRRYNYGTTQHNVSRYLH